MESLFWDESFMGGDAFNLDCLMGSESGGGAGPGGSSGSGTVGVACFDMGGDDYRNATNSDFIIPGLPSLQPNLDELGIVDFMHYEVI